MSETMIDGIEYGPLAGLVGNWAGDKGVDKAPEPDGEERNLYYETMMFEAIGDVTNANEQVLSVLRYHQVVSRKSNDKVFHNETGYLSWDPATGVILQSFSIPRGVAVVASGGVVEDPKAPTAIVIELKAALDSPEGGVAQSRYMLEKAKTVTFSRKLTLEGDSLVYSESTLLDIYGRQYDHTDMNRLKRQ